MANSGLAVPPTNIEELRWTLTPDVIKEAIKAARIEYRKQPLPDNLARQQLALGRAWKVFEAGIRIKLPMNKLTGRNSTIFENEMDSQADPEDIYFTNLWSDNYQILELNKPKPKDKSEEQKSEIKNKSQEEICGVESVIGLKQYYKPICRDLDKIMFDEYKNRKIVICVTMYNEKDTSVEQTLEGIGASLSEDENANTIQPNEMLCVVICDGIKPFIESLVKKHKVTNPDYFQNQININDIDPNFTTHVDSERDVKDKVFNTDGVPNVFRKPDFGNTKLKESFETHEYAHCLKMVYQTLKGISFPIILVIKQGNRGKLNTHYWFFKGICKTINPKFVILLDVGTVPEKYSLARLIGAMEHDANLAGCCGEIVPIRNDFLSFVEGAQIVEYSFAHIFDKALESLIGFITVLPGAFSAYRWDALQGRPLDKYFYSILHPELMNCFKSNVYLAEDRILCNELVFKQGHSYYLRYVRNSVARTDVPSDIFTLLLQRRRWINGSRFALRRTLESKATLLEAFYCCKQDKGKESDAKPHSCCRRFIFSLAILYYFINAFISYFSVGLFFLAFSLTVRQQYPSEVDSQEAINDLFTLGDTILKLFFTALVVNIIVAMGAKPRILEGWYKGLMIIYGCFMGVILYFLIKFFMKGNFEGWVLYSALLTVLGFSLVPVLYGEILTIAGRIFHFLLLTPTYLLMFQIYARCNVHDVTWGNRPDSGTTEAKRKEEFGLYRIKRLIVWAILNLLIGAILNFVDQVKGLDELTEGLVIYFFGIFGGISLIIRIVGSILYFVQEKFRSSLRKRE